MDILPVKLSEQEQEQYPEFTRLLTDLRQYVAADGTSLSVKKDLDQVSR